MCKKKIIRASTIPTSLDTFCKDVLKELSMSYEVVALSSPGKELDAIKTREGVRTIAVTMQRHISPLKDLIALLKLIRVLRHERPWMVHSITPKAGLLCMLAAKMANVPVRIHTFTGLIWPTATGLKRKTLIFTDRILCSCATHIIPEGKGVKNDLITHNITHKPLKILANGNVRGIDLTYYNSTDEVLSVAKVLKKDNRFTFLFVGRIVKDKGIAELISAFNRLNAEYHNTRLVLVGHSEPQLDPLDKETLLSIETHHAIESVGEIDDVRPWYAASDVLVFPSYREGFPNVVIEAGAMGLPAIVTDINGSNEIIINDKNGMIIPPKDSESLYRAMHEIYVNGQLRERLASNARDLIESRYDCHIVRKALYDFYASL